MDSDGTSGREPTHKGLTIDGYQRRLVELMHGYFFDKRRAAAKWVADPALHMAGVGCHRKRWQFKDEATGKWRPLPDKHQRAIDAAAVADRTSPHGIVVKVGGHEYRVELSADQKPIAANVREAPPGTGRRIALELVAGGREKIVRRAAAAFHTTADAVMAALQDPVLDYQGPLAIVRDDHNDVWDQLIAFSRAADTAHVFADPERFPALQTFLRMHYRFMPVGNAYCETLVKKMKALKAQCRRVGELTAERLIAAQCRTHLQMDMTLGQLYAARDELKAGTGAVSVARELNRKRANAKSREGLSAVAAQATAYLSESQKDAFWDDPWAVKPPSEAEDASSGEGEDDSEAGGESGPAEAVEVAAAVQAAAVQAAAEAAEAAAVAEVAAAAEGKLPCLLCGQCHAAVAPTSKMFVPLCDGCSDKRQACWFANGHDVEWPQDLQVGHAVEVWFPGRKSDGYQQGSVTRVHGRGADTRYLTGWDLPESRPRTHAPTHAPTHPPTHPRTHAPTHPSYTQLYTAIQSYTELYSATKIYAEL